MTMLTWLHLSDLHACRPGWDAERVIETLVEDLRSLRADHGLRPDLLFFTGDAAFGEIDQTGSEPEKTIRVQLKRFWHVLTAVRRVYEPEIALDNVFLVPGNHDIDRHQVLPEPSDWLDAQTSVDPVRKLMRQGGFRWRIYTERLRQYREFLEHKGLKHLLDDAERLIWSTTRKVAGLRVGVAGFNSAWSCGRDGERGKLWMAGAYQQGVLRRKLRQTDFSIALMHHAPDWLVEYETPDFGRGLEQDFQFLLHGHEHRAWVLSTAEGYTVVAAGACYEWSRSKRNGYNLVRLDPETGTGEVWLRCYDSTGGGWIPRIIARKTNQHGVWPLKLDWLRETTPARKPAPARKPEPTTTTKITPESTPKTGTEATTTEAATKTRAKTDLARYLQRLRAAHRDLPIAGFETSVRMPIQIDPVYIPLRARVAWAVSDRELRQVGALRELVGDVLTAPEETEHGEAEHGEAEHGEAEHGEAEHSEAERDVAFDESLELARKHNLHGAVVLGDPGSGKTTLLKHFVLASTDPLIGPASLGLPADTVPVLIELRRLTDPSAGLRAAIEQAVATVDVALEARAFTRELLCRDRLLVLVDGLDEVADTGTRAAVSRWLEEAIQHHLPESTFVVTSRYAGYKGDARLNGRFLELHVREVEEAAARGFISAWYGAVESQAELGRDAEMAAALAAAAAEDLSAKVFAPEDERTLNLRRLARNPLMLQIVCLVHRDRKQLPERRVELFRECVKVLLELWRRAKGMPVELDSQQALRLLQPLAYWLHCSKRREAPLAEILPHLAGPLRELRREPEDGVRLLEAIRDQSGVLVSLGQSAYGFLHLSFQEYLSALHVQDRFAKDPSMLEDLADRFGDPWWREVILLSLGLNNPSLFEPLMTEVLARGALPRDVALADDCLRDALSSTALPFLEALADGIENADERYHALRLLRGLKGWQTQAVDGVSGLELVARLARSEEHRTARGMALELLGRDAAAVVSAVEPEEPGREIVHEKDGSVLLYVPGGEFRLGTDEDLPGVLKVFQGKPEHRVILSPYWIGKYPVTNAQYGRFLEQTPDQRKPENWDNKQFNQPEQPVVGVSWGEAIAYCRWAGLVLPSEAQWEAAARGPEGRPYPWGEAAPSRELANYEHQEGRTTPVGAYSKGAGPYGTLDQAGNVWEWCADAWDERAYRDRDGQRDPVAEGDAGEAGVRVLRGGSWAYPSRNLHAAVRFRSGAGHRFRDIGFRVCRFCPEH